jgi:chromosomal replication initiation ATPase DnaA
MIPALLAIARAVAAQAAIGVAAKKVQAWIEKLTVARKSGKVKKGTTAYQKVVALENDLKRAYAESQRKGSNIVKIPTPKSALGIINFMPGKTATQILAGKSNPIKLPKEYHQVIGELESGNSILIHGKPGGGKSYLCLGLAKALAMAGRRVQYLRFEESDNTLRKKLRALKIDGNYTIDFFSDTEYKSCAGYNAVFIDSIQMLPAFDEETIKELKRKYPQSVFVFISQSTKSGQMRGSQMIPHQVDAVIKVEKGLAITEKSRIGGHGEMPITFEA